MVVINFLSDYWRWINRILNESVYYMAVLVVIKCHSLSAFTQAMFA